MDPENAVKEHIANGAPTTDSRVIALLPKEITSNKIVYPDEAALTPLEFGAAVALTDPGRTDGGNPDEPQCDYKAGPRMPLTPIAKRHLTTAALIGPAGRYPGFHACCGPKNLYTFTGPIYAGGP